MATEPRAFEVGQAGNDSPRRVSLYPYVEAKPESPARGAGSFYAWEEARWTLTVF